jgi:two-component sensor histidine kinase
MKHRLKNNLSTVLAIARQSFRGRASGSEEFRKFESRLVALANGHDLISRDRWDSAELKDLVAQILAIHGAGRFEVNGSDVRLSPRSTLALTLALHELATNASKYGALSVPTGHITISWSVRCTDLPNLVFRWQELNGPSVSLSRQKGFGSKLLEHVLAHELKGEVRIIYDSAGVICEIVAPLSAEWEVI